MFSEKAVHEVSYKNCNQTQMKDQNKDGTLMECHKEMLLLHTSARQTFVLSCN